MVLVSLVGWLVGLLFSFCWFVGGGGGGGGGGGFVVVVVVVFGGIVKQSYGNFTGIVCYRCGKPHMEVLSMTIVTRNTHECCSGWCTYAIIVNHGTGGSCWEYLLLPL